jgi:hypothetical protein
LSPHLCVFNSQIAARPFTSDIKILKTLNTRSLSPCTNRSHRPMPFINSAVGLWGSLEVSSGILGKSWNTDWANSDLWSLAKVLGGFGMNDQKRIWIPSFSTSIKGTRRFVVASTELLSKGFNITLSVCFEDGKVLSKASETLCAQIGNPQVPLLE